MKRWSRDAGTGPGRRGGLGLVEITIGAALSTVVLACALLLARQSLFGSQRMGEQLDLSREARVAETCLRHDLSAALAGGSFALGPSNDTLVLTLVVADTSDPARAREVQVRYAPAMDVDGKVRLMRGSRPLASAPVRGVSFERSPSAPGLVKVSFTLLGSRKGSEVACSFLWSSVNPLSSQPSTAGSTSSTAAADAV